MGPGTGDGILEKIFAFFIPSTDRSAMLDLNAFNARLLTYLNASPTPFHAVSQAVERLRAHGFEVLQEADAWQLRPEGRYVVVRNGSALIAFNGALPSAARSRGIRLFGAHSDSPCLRVKPQPEMLRKGCFQLGVEVYGGVLLAPWFDRDLSLAGRVVYRDTGGAVRQCLVDWRRPVAVIPSLAIHLDREVNSNRSINPQKELPPVLLQADTATPDFRALVKAQVLAEWPACGIDKVLDYELSFYDSQPAAVVGLAGDFIASARLDNLLSCCIGVEALIAAAGREPCLLVLNDHEEVGSSSAEGACGPLLLSVLRRVLGADEEVLVQALQRSLLISADNAHGVHPNYSERHDEQHGPLLNQGPVIKINANQRYATNAISAGFYRALSERLGLPCQVFVTRADLACGSTIGPLTATQLGVRTLDIGVPQFAMHSIRELCGSRDPHILYQAACAFFDTAELPM